MYGTGRRYARLIVFIVTIVFILNIMWYSAKKTKTLDMEKLSENLSERGKEKYINFYLDLTHFKLVINNDICGDDDIKIITIVTTALENDVSNALTC